MCNMMRWAIQKWDVQVEVMMNLRCHQGSWRGWYPRCTCVLLVRLCDDPDRLNTNILPGIDMLAVDTLEHNETLPWKRAASRKVHTELIKPATLYINLSGTYQLNIYGHETYMELICLAE